jgi:hypothetical protein
MSENPQTIEDMIIQEYDLEEKSARNVRLFFFAIALIGLFAFVVGIVVTTSVATGNLKKAFSGEPEGL